MTISNLFTGRGAVPQSSRSNGFGTSVCLLQSSAEAQSLGGPSIRVPRTAELLQSLGVSARVSSSTRPCDIPEDIVHLFNVWPPANVLQTLHQLRAAGKRVVFSPIYLDFREQPVWDLAADHSPETLRCHLEGRGRLFEIVPGYHDMMREMLELADHVIFLSQAERSALAAIGAAVPEERSSLVHNPVDAAHWQGGDPALFRETYLATAPATEYVLCVGRIEPRKNQLMLARAMQKMPQVLVLVGHDGDADYANRIRQETAGAALITGRLAPTGNMLRSALAGASAFALPSWTEGASLAALEAAAAGCALILSDRSSEKEYFGDLAHYCNPGDATSIRAAIQAVLDDPERSSRRTALQQHVTRHYHWQGYAQATIKAYKRALETPQRQRPQLIRRVPKPDSKGLALDLTCLTRPDALPKPILLGIQALTRALVELGNPPRPIAWSSKRGCFLDMPPAFLSPQDAARFAAQAADDESLPPATLPVGTDLLLLGGAWGTDRAHLSGLSELKGATGGAIVAMIEDAGPCLRPDLFSAGEAASFDDCFHLLAQIADHIVTPSTSTHEDVIRALEEGPVPPRSDKISTRSLPPLVETTGNCEPALRARFEQLRFALMPGTLSERSNVTLLTRIWARFARDEMCSDLHLLIAGGIAKGAEALADRLFRDPRINQRIHVLDVGRTDLSWLFQTALISLSPSDNEDPDWIVGKSLTHGTPCLVARRPSQTDPRLVEVLDPDDLPLWQSRITEWARDKTIPSPPAVAHHPAISWHELASDLAKLARVAHPVSTARALRPGQPVLAGYHAPPLSIRFGLGWHPAQENLRWASAEAAHLKLHIPEMRDLGQGRFLLLLDLCHALPPGHRARLRVMTGDNCLFSAPMEASHFPRDLLLSIPCNAIDDQGDLSLTLHMPTALVRSAGPEQKGHAQSRQEIRGIGLVSLTVIDPERNNPLTLLKKSERLGDGEKRQSIDLTLDSHRNIVSPDLEFSPAWGAGGRRAGLALFLPLLPNAADQVLELEIRPVARPETPSGAYFFLNNRLITQKHWQDDQPVRLSLTLPSQDLVAAPAVLEIVPASLATPADLGLGQETGIAGLGIFGLVLRPRKTMDESSCSVP